MCLRHNPIHETASLQARSPAARVSQLAVIAMQSTGLVKTEFSRISSRSLAGLAQREYGLPEPVHCRLMAPDRVLYEVRSPAGKAVLRLHEALLLGRPASPLVGFQYEWARFLRQADLPVSFPIPRRSGSLFGVLEAAEGERCFGLWSHADGDARLTKERSRLLGETLARVHMASDSFQSSSDALRFDLEALLHKPQERLARFFAGSRPDDVRFLNDVCGRLSGRLQRGLTELPPWSFGPIWGDANGSNQHFTGEPGITILDFELAGLGWRLWDLATFRWARDRAMRDAEGLWQALLEGYESVRPLGGGERHLMPHFVLLRHIWVLASTVADHVECPEMAPVFLTVPKRWDRAFSELREIAGGIEPE